MNERKHKTISVMAKCSDMCSLKTDTNLVLTGYVPSNCGIGVGDYIYFDIDIETGKIINWPKLTDEDIDSIFEEEDLINYLDN